MTHAQLNDSPKIRFQSPGYHLKFELKLKYKKWIKLPAVAPLLGIECHCFLLFTVQAIDKASNKVSNHLQNYTQQQLSDQIKESTSTKYYNKQDTQRFAHFNYELDLHIEKITTESGELSTANIFEIQLVALQQYMQQAIELEVQEVFIIHGIGTGRLQKAVAKVLKELQQHRMIQEFRNEYIPKYGFGATHVKIS